MKVTASKHETSDELFLLPTISMSYISTHTTRALMYNPNTIKRSNTIFRFTFLWWHWQVCFTKNPFEEGSGV